MASAIYLNLQAPIDAAIASKLISAVEDHLRKRMTDLHLLIASPGGLVDPGMAIFNFLRGIPARVFTYNYGSVDSVASVVYCAGARRFATPHCKFLIHGVTWSWPPSPQGLVVTENQLQECLGQINVIKRNIASVIAEATGKKVDEVAGDMARSLTLNAEEARTYGLAHDMATTLVPAGADVVGIR